MDFLSLAIGASFLGVLVYFPKWISKRAENAQLRVTTQANTMSSQQESAAVVHHQRVEPDGKEFETQEVPSSSNGENSPRVYTFTPDANIPGSSWELVAKPKLPSSFPGEAVEVVSVEGENRDLIFKEHFLESILLREDVQDKPIVVISVAGAYRTGKSFLLSYILRYLVYKSDWMIDENLPLTGFTWDGGSNRVTNGIVMWSEPFFAFTPDGQEVAILLMDTQGTDEPGTHFKDSVAIFSLSTLLSSVQIFNIPKRIGENNMSELQFFTEYGNAYGSLKSSESLAKPYQTIIFLIRDWNSPRDHPYGKVGGEQYLERVLKKDVSYYGEVRSRIRSFFENISGFLLPYPGSIIDTNETGDGKLSEISEDFKTQLQDFIPPLFDQGNLVLKVVGTTPIKAKDFYLLFKKYVETFHTKDLPKPLTVFQATVEMNIIKATGKAKDFYQTEKEQLIRIESVNFGHLREESTRIYNEALTLFDGDIAFRTQATSMTARYAFIQYLDENHESYNALVDSRETIFNVEMERLENERRIKREFWRKVTLAGGVVGTAVLCPALLVLPSLSAATAVALAGAGFASAEMVGVMAATATGAGIVGGTVYTNWRIVRNLNARVEENIRQNGVCAVIAGWFTSYRR